MDARGAFRSALPREVRDVHLLGSVLSAVSVFAGVGDAGATVAEWLREFLFFWSIGTDSTAKEDLVMVKGTIKDLMGEIEELKTMVNESNKMLVEHNIAAWRR